MSESPDTQAEAVAEAFYDAIYLRKGDRLSQLLHQGHPWSEQNAVEREDYYLIVNYVLAHPRYADWLAQRDKDRDAAVAAKGVHEFVQWVATQRAFNGAGDPGQALYDYSLNAVLPKWATEFTAALRAEGGGDRG